MEAVEAAAAAARPRGGAGGGACSAGVAEVKVVWEPTPRRGLPKLQSGGGKAVASTSRDALCAICHGASAGLLR